MLRRGLQITSLVFFSLWGCSGDTQNYVCGDNSICAWECADDTCNIACGAGSECSAVCNAEVCNLACEAGATCDFECNGEVCNIACAEGSSCSSAPDDPRKDSSVPDEDASVPDEDASVPEEDASVPEEDSGHGGAAGMGEEGVHGCADLCAALTAPTQTCVRELLSSLRHPLNTTSGCEALLNVQACTICMTHLQVADAHCITAFDVCQ